MEATCWHQRVKHEAEWYHKNPWGKEKGRMVKEDPQGNSHGTHERIDDGTVLNIPKMGAPPHPHIWNTPKHPLQFLKLKLNGCPRVLILNFTLQQFSFCLFQKRDRIKFYCAFYTWETSTTKHSGSTSECLFCSEWGQSKGEEVRGSLHTWLTRTQGSAP